MSLADELLADLEEDEDKYNPDQEMKYVPDVVQHHQPMEQEG